MRKTIKAKENFILTDGEVFGKEILLGEGRNESDFHEITKEEYEAILAAYGDNTEEEVNE